MIGEKSASQHTAGEILGHYRILEKMGSGGLYPGVTYDAQSSILATCTDRKQF